MDPLEVSKTRSYSPIKRLLGVIFASLVLLIIVVYAIRLPLANWVLAKVLTDTGIGVRIEKDIDIRLLQRGIYLRGLRIEYAPLDAQVRVRSVGADHLSLSSLSQFHIGKLALVSLDVAVKGEAAQLALTDFSVNDIAIDTDQMRFAAALLSVGQLKSSLPGIPGVGWRSLQLKNISASAEASLGLDQLTWNGPFFEGTNQAQRISLSKLQIDKANVDSGQIVSVERFAIEEPTLRIPMDDNGQWSPLLPQQQTALTDFLASLETASSTDKTSPADKTLQDETPEKTASEEESALSITLGTFEITQMDTQLSGLPVLAFKTLSVKTLALPDTQNLSIAQIDLNGLRYGDGESLVLDELILAIKDLNLSNGNNLAIDDIGLNINKILLSRAEEGPWNFFPIQTAEPAAESGIETEMEPETETEENTEADGNTTSTAVADAETKKEAGQETPTANDPPKEPDFGWSIKHFALAPGLSISIHDKQLPTELAETVTINKASATNLHNQLALPDTEIELQAMLGAHSELNAFGRMKLLTAKKNFHSRLKIENYELPAITGLSEMATGYAVQTGQMNIDSKIDAKDGILDGEVVIDLFKLVLISANQETIEKLNKNMTMPLPIALSVLEDSDEHIELKVPVEGDANSPEFSPRGLGKLLMSKALKMATLHYVQQTLFPQLGMLRMAGAVGGFMLDNIMELPPMYFEPKAHKLTDEHKAFIDNIGKMLADKKKLNIHICGAATEQDGDDKKAQLAIAQKRADTIRQYLIDSYQLDPTRLLQCRAAIDLKSEKGPYATVRF